MAIPSNDGRAFAHARVAQVRIARHTARLDAVVAFYRDGLGLPELYRFVNHDGYDGVMLGLPDKTYHLEFTQQPGSPAPATPSGDDLLVLYIPDRAQLASVRERLERLGYHTVVPRNPYWLREAVTFEDPDGRRVVLCNTAGI
jgi:catechol 2,3-dioxygenase-like lactoylglutathione lyase family enzyme